MIESQNNICVVHLVRKSNGIEPFKQFISTYKRYDAGIQHELLFLFKGFSDQRDIIEYENVAKNLAYKILFVSDTGFDIGSYLCAYNENKEYYKYFCFMNSYSMILSENWLEKLYRHITDEKVGIVGATGSYQSILSDSRYKNYAYGRVFKFHPIRKPVVKLRLYLRQFKYRASFPEFPNPHIRTNGFMVSEKVLRNIKVTDLRKKNDAYRFESGKNSLTNQIVKMGLRPVVVDSSGKAYNTDEWYESNTFRRSNQENLLIADNQTRIYEEANTRLKVILSHHAWGKLCCPDESILL